MNRDTQQHHISLTLATQEDIPALSLMAGKTFWHTFTGQMPEEDLQAYIATAFSPERFLTEWQQSGNTFIIARYNEEWAGYAKLSTCRRTERPEQAPYMELERLYLLPAYQGKKTGARLMAYCIQHAREQAFDTLWLNVWEHNTAAMDFYRRWGFETVDWSVMMRGNDPQKAWWMKKYL